MADEEYNKKLESLQQYIPFLNNMIMQLKDPRKKNREQQLAKMVSLHSMITDKKKKLKLETLIKCEDVILKLYDKVKSGSHGQAQPARTTSAHAPSTPFSPITPSSPSPPRDILKTKPVVIPTEKIVDTLERETIPCNPGSYKAKIDIYSSAADSLKSTSPQKSNVFDRLGKKGPDMSKPPISMEDLEALQQEVLTERMSLNELTNLREKLQKQLKSNDDDQSRSSPINTTVRNTTILTKKAVEKATTCTDSSKSKSTDTKPVVKPATTVPKPVKVIKEAASIFGSTLSSIDNKILEGASKHKEKERRTSISGRKDSTESRERRNSKDDKKESSSHKSSKDKTDRKSSEHKSRDKKDEDKKSNKDKKDDKKVKSDDKDKKQKDDDKKKSDDRDKKEDKQPCKDDKVEDRPQPQSETNEVSKFAESTPPVYKRLADKYNPKPRKPSIEAAQLVDVPKNVTDSIENSMKNAPTIPFLDNKTPPKPQPLLAQIPQISQLPLTTPLLSPTSSTNSADNEIASFNRKPLLPPPQMNNVPNLSIPSHVSSILSNPNTTALINNVVNQFKGRQTPLLPPAQNAFPRPNSTTPAQNFPPNEMHYNVPNQQPLLHPPNNYWGNQPQPVHQNYPQRSFTPLPSQFDNQMQQIDYYPPGSTPTHNYNHQGPPLLSPQHDSYDPRPRKFDEPFYGNKDVDMRYNRDTEWRRPTTPHRPPREPYRDPRLQRDPRGYDPRRETTPRRDIRDVRDSRDYDRDNRNKFRDPRLNRYRYERDRSRDNDREREREQPSRSMSRSLSRESEEKDTFMSPLDSLYSGNEGYRKTGKGYGVQNFKIPKIKKEEEGVEREETEAEVKKAEPETKKAEPEPQPDPVPEPEEKIKEPEPKTVEESEENVASTSVSSSTECESKETTENQTDVSKESAEVGEISSSTEDVKENQKTAEPKVDAQDSTDTINNFLKTLLGNERTRAAVSLFIDNLSNSLDDEKLKMVVQTVKSADVEEKEPAKKRGRKKRRIVNKAKVSPTRKKLAARSKMRLRKKKPVPKFVEDEDEDDEVDEEVEEEEEDKKEEVVDEEVEEEEEEEEEKVMVSVGERIKSRKRVASTSGAPKKKKTKHKTELDLLHEDIQDMFIRDGVLTATGKRMCRLLKNENPPPPPPPVEPRTRRAKSEKFDSKTNSDKFKVMSNVRVLIPKIPVDKMTEDENQRYLLRRANKANKSYAEVDSEDEKEKEREKEREKEKEKEKKKRKEEEETEEEKEEEKAEDEPKSPVKEKVEEKEKEKVEPPKKVRKRAKSWASGNLPKRKKKVVEEKEESDKSVIFVEPDKEYYSSKQWHHKTPCKLCDYNNKNITKHYRTKHPDSEVLSSRLSPSRAEEAIKMSQELKLDDSPDHAIPSTKRCSFKCRFCELEMNCQPSNFYDHISTHTGEYRHLCHLCDFNCANNKPLRQHYAKVHEGDKYNKAPWVRTRIYGFICLECNFVQTKKKTVENHINVYHLGEGKKVMKIHLSTLDDEAAKEEPLKESKAAETTTDQSEEKESEETEIEEPIPKKKKVVIEEKEQTPPVSPVKPVIKKEKEIDMTVFTCNTDIQEENEKIEQERLQKMAELNETVKKTNRQSLNFVDQLSNRLSKEKTPEPEPVIIKTEPVDVPSEPEPEFEPEPEPLVEVTPRKPTKMIEPPVPTVEVVQKDNRFIEGMIQKLQGKLKEEKNNDEPPPLAPLIEKKSTDEKIVLSAGFLNIRKCSEGLEYACRVPSCLFTTTSRAGFLVHWNEDHTKINERFKVTKCRICQIDITETDDATLLNNFFSHVEKTHLDGGTTVVVPPSKVVETLENTKTVVSPGFMQACKEDDGYRFVCKISSCQFTTKSRDSFISHWETEHLEVNAEYRATKCGVCQVEVKATTDSLLNKFFLHVESEHLKTEAETPHVIRMRRLSGDQLSSTKAETSPELKEADENPFPFKISGVMSLAEDPVPPLSPIRDKTQIQKSVILKEAKMTKREKATAWKSPEAIKKFLQCPRELYKCPQFTCKYATSWRHLFDSHIKAHARVNDELVCCVYCDVKTPLSQSGLHIDLRHSNCLYSCSQCLYRALKREYVMIHMKLRHKESDLIISLPQKAAKAIMSKNKMNTVREACLPYKCGNKDCDAEFLFLNEYLVHMKSSHDKMLRCGFETCTFHCVVADNIVDHWRTHGCYNFHCLICKVGCMEMYTMLEHYSLTHPNMEPMVVDRRQSPEGTVYGYTEEGAGQIKYLNEELLESINAQQYTVLPSTPEPPKPVTESPKNVAILPLLIQPSSNESKKIIAIIPKSVDGSVPSAVQLLTAVSNMSKETVTSSPSFVFASITPDDSAKEKEEEATAKENTITIEDTPADPAADPLSLDTVSASGEDSDSQELNESSDVMKSFGLIGYQLYRCAVCDISFSNARDFKAHTIHSKQCRDTTNTLKPFKCVHCGRLFKNPHGLLEHIQYHGPLRFGCSMCVKKFPSSFSLKLHMRSKHNVTNTITTPLVSNKTNLDRDEFIIRPVPMLESDNGKEGSNVQTSLGHKAVYGPDEIEQLPKRYIFNSDVKCALCSYSTKVRTNLVRHLQFHSSEKSVPDIAPVNPVPCLDKNEKMFDKMTNLALSSFSGSSSGRMGGAKQETKVVKEEHTQVPAYVPSHRRYVCCAEGCNYLCLEEANLRHHLYALHVQEPSFTCAHCKMNLKTGIEGFLKHLKLHDLHLYKCSGCMFVHNLRHKVDKHAADKHQDKPANTITIRSLEAEIVDVEPSSSNAGGVSETSAPNIKWTKPWHCGVCKYRCAAKNDIIAHVLNKHDINTQYKCTWCLYKTNDKETFSDHFKENHPNNEIDIIHVYYKSEGSAQTGTSQKQFDTTPLWQRDRPRVRHIRGILFEDSSPQKAMKKTFTKTPMSTSNLDLAIDAVAKGIDEATSSRNLELKEKEVPEKVPQDDSIIVIEDDEEDEIVRDPLREEEESELTIDVEGSENNTNDVKMEADISFLNEEILVKKYGAICSPLAKAFRCPICLKFRTKKISYFVYHLLNELKCQRFTCKLCDFSSITSDSILSHCQEKHNGSEGIYSEKPMDKTVEYWMQILIRSQAKVLVQQGQLPPGDGLSSPGCKTQCEYCLRWFKNVNFLKEHELCHWADHTYRCAHCCSEQADLNDLFQHTFLSHPRFEVVLTTNGPYVGSLITTLKAPSPAALPADDTQYICQYCNEFEKSVEALQRHVAENHEGEELSYKVVTKTKVEVMYACTHCHDRGSEQFLKKHHEETHKGLKYSIYQFICLECSGTFLNIKDLRAHFSKVHTGKKLTYSCVESKESGSKDQYCCIKCPFRSCTMGGIRSHLRKHLRPVDCGLCGATFVYPTEARAHHNKEHIHNTVAVVENAERMKEYEETVQQIVANRKAKVSAPPPTPSPPPPPPPPPPPQRRMLARKSTGAPFVREYSYYGAKKEETDLKNVSTSIE